jgi:tetratricopeptide (TPR) repeat protein
MNGNSPVTARWNAAVRAMVFACLLAVPGAPAVHAEPYEANPDAAARDPDYAAGKAAMDRQDWQEAARRFQRAAANDPDNPDLQNYLGYAHRRMKQLDRAFIYYKRALELDPHHRGAHEYIGETYLMTGDLVSAEKHLAALRGICLLSCEELVDLEKAIALYRTGVGTMPRGLN